LQPLNFKYKEIRALAAGGASADDVADQIQRKARNGLEADQVHRQEQDYGLSPHAISAQLPLPIFVPHHVILRIGTFQTLKLNVLSASFWPFTT
jgi:hypothetical protein